MGNGDRTDKRIAGLRLMQMWVPDTRAPGFTQEARSQCRLVAKADEADVDLQRLMDAALKDVDGWTG